MSLEKKRKLAAGLIGLGVILVVIAAALMQLLGSSTLTGGLGFVGLCAVVCGGVTVYAGLRCPHCGKHLPSDWRVGQCPKCGKDIE